MTDLDTSKHDAPNETNEDTANGDDDDEFDWDEYLKRTNAEQAPSDCFAQSNVPPANEFAVGQKLETNDPRNTSSICLATIIETAGPRLRLRLDGTDNRNDFWLMCDSDLIHPFEYSAKHGRKIQPPLGYGNDLSKWPKFLEKIIASSHTSDVFASETCFKQPPVKPLKNEFKVGYKLEAVDPKNPHLICPATVKEITRDKILISFDGWSNSSQFWINFSSRDLFPCGWCKKTGHILQHPGDLEEPKIKPKNRSLVKAAKVTAKKKSQNESINDSLNNSGANLVDTVQSTPNEPKKTDKKLIDTTDVFDLSIVKSEAVEPCIENNINVNTSINSKVISRGPCLTLYVHPGYDCGKMVNSTKFHKAHTKFGPGQPANIYKSIVQSFVDCAVNRAQVFQMIPDGTGVQIVRYKTSTSSERKKLNPVKNVKDMWDELKKICDLLTIDETKMFACKPFADKLTSPSKSSPKTPPLENKENVIKEKNIPQKEEFPLTPQASSCSSSTSSLSQDQNLLKIATSKFNNGVNKRRLSTDESEAKTIKLNKRDTMPINEWTIENVVEYIQSLGDYFTSHVDAFKHHEIDGKALLLLTTDILMKYMGFKLGPALKLNNFLDKLRVNQAGGQMNVQQQQQQQQLKTEKTFNC